MLVETIMESQIKRSDQTSTITLSNRDSEHASAKVKSPGPSSMLPQQHEAAATPHAVEASQSPFPDLAWVNSSELWNEMRSRDICKADPEVDFIVRHPSIPLYARPILLDWMMEVCEGYKLQRETYHLALDIYDRFMDAQDEFPVEKLQLLGATCLFLACKIEESESREVALFLRATDNFFQAADIFKLEFVMCEVLDWKVSHHSVTVNTWTKAYLQVASNCLSPPGPGAKPFEYPMYSTADYVRVMQLLDFCCVDIACREYGNSVLAASAVYVTLEKHRTSLGRITGFELANIIRCVDWLQPFSAVVYKQERSSRESSSPSIKSFLLDEDPINWHNIQVRNFDMELGYEEVERLRVTRLQAAPDATGSSCCTCI